METNNNFDIFRNLWNTSIISFKLLDVQGGAVTVESFLSSALDFNRKSANVSFIKFPE